MVIFRAILFLTLLNQMILTLRLQGVLLTSPLRIGYMESSYGIPLRYQPCSYQCNIELFVWRWASVKGLWIIVRDILASSKWELVILNGGVRRAGGLAREVQPGDEFWLHMNFVFFQNLFMHESKMLWLVRWTFWDNKKTCILIWILVKNMIVII